jgi:hypothetical protein
MLFKSKNPQYEHLRKKWFQKHKLLQENLFEKHIDVHRPLLLSGIGGLMLLATPATISLPQNIDFASGGESITKATDKNIQLTNALKDKTPTEVRSLDSNEEEQILNALGENLGLSVKAEIDGVRLNRNYGLIGGEQHLYRYPGDTLYKHADNAQDWIMYGGSGIAPGLGAWGYFAPSEKDFSEKDKMREKYYLAIQTFLAPGYSENLGKYRDFFKFRKMLVVNPKTGQAVVAVIGDAGPAEWTGKHLGGSPEVMHFLGLAGGPRKGAVLYFFIDDPSDSVPLGPIKEKFAES